MVIGTIFLVIAIVMLVIAGIIVHNSNKKITSYELEIESIKSEKETLKKIVSELKSNQSTLSYDDGVSDGYDKANGVASQWLVSHVLEYKGDGTFDFDKFMNDYYSMMKKSK